MRRARCAVLLAAVLASGCGDDGGGADSTTEPPVGSTTLIELEIIDEKLVGGIRKESVTQGDPIQLAVTGDSADQIHIHGYDRYVELVDGEGELLFDALIPGRFEVELEGSGQLLIELEVTP